MPGRQRLLLITLGLAYLGASLWVTTNTHSPLVNLSVALGPVLLPFALSLRKSRWFIPFMGLMLAGIGMVAWQGPLLNAHLDWFYFVQYTAILTPLMWTFGRTLTRDPSTALCSRIAGLLHPQGISPAMMHHTWLTTWAWTLLLAGCLLVSGVMFFTFPAADWSFFTDILTPLSLGSLFMLEWLVRRWRFPDAPRPGLLSTVRAWQHFQNTSKS
ncbi:MAG: hypothetical protein M0Z78_03455 [Betaproteobacteria bacterium]|nr:hypothetical protein [Betaproteobacteria bacterium]